MDNEVFRRIFKRRNYKLYSYIYEVRYTCLVPKIASVHPMDREVFITPEPDFNSFEQQTMYTFGDLEHHSTNSFGDSMYDYYVNDKVEDIFKPFNNSGSIDYGLNKKTGVKLSIYDMAKLYDEGHYIYIYNAKDLKEIYGLMESFISYKLKYYKGPNTGFGLENDDDLYLIDELATSIVNVYKDADSELYYYIGKGTVRKRRDHLMKKPESIKNDIVIRTGKKVTREISIDRLKELGLE